MHTEFLSHYEPLHEYFCKYCRAICGNQEDANDLIQDSILNVLEKFDSIKDLSAFKSYLFSVAGNLYKKKQRRNKFRASFNEAEVNQIIDFGQNQEYVAEFSMVYEKILSLPDRIAQALILFHIADMRIEDIRDIQGGSVPAVKSRLQRGREKVLAMLNTPAQVRVALMLFTL